MFSLKNKKYMVVFVRKEQESYTFLRKVRVKSSARVVRYSKKQMHVVDLTYPSYIKGLNYYYLIDIDSKEKHKDKESKEVYFGGQLRYKGSNLEYDAGILSLITVESGIRQLASTLHDKLFNGNTIIITLMGLGLGVFAGLFIGVML